MTIIRIEHITGNGLWRAKTPDGNWLIETLSCYSEIFEKHKGIPTPYRDNLLNDIYQSEFCAFDSIESFRQWIEPSWIEELIRNDYKVLMLDVSSCRIGTHQVLYQKNNVLQSKDITSLFIIK